MEAKALLHPPGQFEHRPIQTVLVRANGPLFYSVVIASLLEAVAALSAERLLHFIRNDRELSRWALSEWLPRKAARAQVLQRYVEKMWPEFDWSGAYEQYRNYAQAEGGLGPRRATAAQELLARCVAAAQTGLFYRCLARWADDPALREMARAMAQSEAEWFTHFRRAYEYRARQQRFGFAAAWRTALGCVRAARDTHVQLAFCAVGAHCGAHVPFPVLGYGELIARMQPVIERYGEIGTPERVLLRPWKSRPACIRIEEKKHRVPDWFKPFFKDAA